MDYPSLKPAFDHDGFVVVRGFVTGAELDELHANLDRYIRGVVPTLPDAHAFYQDRARPETLKQLQFLEVDDYFNTYRRRPKWREIWEAMFGVPVGEAGPLWFNKPPGVEHPTPAHQDNYYAFYEPCHYGTVWLALDLIDDDNGCLHYVPGSHKAGFRPHATTSVLGFSQGITDYGPSDTAIEATVHLAPGDAIVHHGMTIHRADPNRTKDRQRRAFAMAITGVGIKRDEEAYERHLAKVAAQHAKFGILKK